MTKGRKSSPASRREAKAEFEALCRDMLAGLQNPVSRVFRRIVRAPATSEEPLFFVIWEWHGKEGPGISIGLEESRPAFEEDIPGMDDLDWRSWDRRLGVVAWSFFQDVLRKVLAEWWTAVGGSQYPRRVLIGEHDLNAWVDLLTGKRLRL